MSAQHTGVDTPEPRRLSHDLEMLRARVGVDGLTLREVEASLHGRGFGVLILLCSLPFALPIPIPGLSVPFGLIISLLGFRLMIGRHPWLPKKLLDRSIPHGILNKMLGGGVRLALLLERFARKRLLLISCWPLMQNLIGLAILIAGLALCLPPPMINAIPAWALLFLTAGMLEKDGLFILAGYFITFCIVLFLVFLGIAGRAGFEKLLAFF